MLDTLTPDKARAALEKLEAVKAQRAAENKLATFKASRTPPHGGQPLRQDRMRRR